MTITTPALAAAFRLATSRPVHRHEWRPPADTQQPTRSDGRARREQVRELLDQKIPQRKIAQLLHVSHTTVVNHVRAIKAERGQ